MSPITLRSHKKKGKPVDLPVQVLCVSGVGEREVRVKLNRSSVFSFSFGGRPVPVKAWCRRQHQVSFCKRIIELY